MQVSHVDEHVTHAVIGGRKTIDFDISNSAEFFHILSSTLYTDQRLAVIREVVCNAWDAHIASGRTNLPVEVTLKDNQIMIRDFGYGIADEDMGHIYGTYGNSTKQNDGKQTGGFGLGCKAPFAYTDHFQVVSHNKGTKTIYALSRSSAVVGGKPGITPIVSMPTEESGLSVSIPIKNNGDASYLIQKLKDLVFFGDIFLTFNGNVLPRINFDTSDGKFYALSNALTRDHLHVRYGNVIYPINEAQELGTLVSQAKQIVQKAANYHKVYGLLLQAPPHSISVTPSRESLSMQENTVVTLKDLLSRFIKEHNDKKIDALRLQIVRDSFSKPTVDSLVEKAFSNDIDCTFFKTELKGTLTSVYDCVQSSMQSNYPHEVSVRMLEVEERIKLLTRLGKITKQTGISFLKAYQEDIQENFDCMFSRHYYGKVIGTNKWFYQVYAKNIIKKIQTSTLKLDRLYVSDRKQIRYSDTKLEGLQRFDSVRFMSINDCFPYLRNIVVLGTSRAAMKNGARSYDSKNSVYNGSGFLFYHVGMKKNDEQEALDFWKSTGMTVINTCGLNVTVRSATPKKPKKEGYPLLSSVWNKEKARIDLRKSEVEDVPTSNTPEFFVKVSIREETRSYIPGFSSCTELFFKHFGSRGVLVNNTRSEEILKKKGVLSFGDFMAKQLYAHIAGNAAIFKNASMETERIIEAFHGNYMLQSSARVLLSTPELVELFKLEPTELDTLDQEYLTMFYAVLTNNRMSEDNFKLLSGLKESLVKVPLSTEAQAFIKELKANPVVAFMDLNVFREKFVTADTQEKALLIELFKTMFYL